MNKQWKPREKAVKSRQNQVCDGLGKKRKTMFCDQSAPAVCDCCSSYGAEIWFVSRYEFFEVFSHLGPLWSFTQTATLNR